MKKILFAVSLIVVGLLVVSCDNSAPESPQTYYLPHFTGGGESISSRGLIDMGDWDDFGTATSVMTYAPMMTALIPVEGTSSEVEGIIHDSYGNFCIYGFKASYSMETLSIDEDHMYIRYYVSDSKTKTIAGVIDYYLDLNSYRFSYREIVALTLGFKDRYLEPSILSIELDNVALEPDGSFSAGENRNAIVDFVDITSTGDGILTRTYPHMRSSKGVLAVFLDPRELGRFGISIGPNDVKPILEDLIGSNYSIDNEKEAKNFGHNVFQYLLNQFYQSGGSLSSHDPRSGGHDLYDTYDEYRRDSIRAMKNHHPRQDDFFTPTEDFIVFEYDTMKAATLSTGVDITSIEQGQLVDDKDKLAKMGFAAFYPEVLDEGFTIEEFIGTHLRKAGVEDNAYIQSYIDGWKKDWK